MKESDSQLTVDHSLTLVHTRGYRLRQNGLELAWIQAPLYPFQFEDVQCLKALDNMIFFYFGGGFVPNVTTHFSRDESVVSLFYLKYNST